jgi:hypothetical protein
VIEKMKKRPLEWTFEMEHSIRDYVQFLTNVHDYIQKESYQVEQEKIDLAVSMLEIPLVHFQTYRKLYAITYSTDYWLLTPKTRQVLELFYAQEEDYADKIEQMPMVFLVDKLLQQMKSLKVIDQKTVQQGFELVKKLRMISHELRTVFLANIATDFESSNVWFKFAL